jgi:parallel beta-helix repeat protein
MELKNNLFTQWYLNNAWYPSNASPNEWPAARGAVGWNVTDADFTFTNDIQGDPLYKATGTTPGEYYSLTTGSPAHSAASDGNDIGAWQTPPVHNITQNTYFYTIQEAINAAVANDIIEIASGTLIVTSQVNINKANLKIQGVSNTSTKIQVSGTGYRFYISASGVTIQNMEIEKTDKTTQDIIGIHANNTSIKNNIIHGQFVIGDGEVSRAMMVEAGNFTGLLMSGNTIFGLRQPVYVNGEATGVVSNNYTYRTKGWVIATKSNLNFSGNTWGTGANVNYYDIAIFSDSPEGANNYPDIVTMSANNNDAIIENQHSSYSPAILSIVHVDKNTTTTGNNGSILDPYKTISPAIPRVAPRGKIYVAAGTYNEQILIQKSLILTGASISNTIIKTPATRTLNVVNGTDTWDYLVAAYPASGTINVHINGFTIDANGTNNTGGTTKLTGLFMRDVSGTGAGLFSSKVHNFGTTEYTSWGIVTFRNSSLTIDGDTIGDFTRDGILVKGGDGSYPDPTTTISNNTVTGNSTALNGINVNGGAAVAYININHVTGLTRNTPLAGCGILLSSTSHSSTITGNTVEECWDGVGIQGVSGLNIDGNIIKNIYDQGIEVDNSNNCTFTNNNITDCKPSLNAGILLVNSSTGNIIGTSGNGNTIALPVTGTGNLYGINLPNTIGAGNNTISYNTFNGGQRFIQIDGGNTGTTTIAHNTMGNTTAPIYGAVSMNGGSANITYNALTNTVRPMEFDGAINLDINNNTVNGATYDGINLGTVSGTISIENNTISNCTGGSGIHCRTDADNVFIDCNDISLSRDGVIIDTGSTGNSITNNNIHNNTFSGITASEALATVSGNTIDNCWRGIETSQALTANNNKFINNKYGSVIFHSNDAHDVTNNWWGNTAGPSAYLNGINLNTYNQANQVQFIQANSYSNFTFSPWLNSGVDNEPGTCGFQPATGTSFAPVYANATGDTTETEKYASIQAAVAATTLAYVKAKAGTYKESQIVVLNKGLTIQGAGVSVTTIDGGNAIISGAGTKPGIIYFKNPNVAIKIDGFTFTNPVNNTTIGEIASIAIAFGTGATTPLLVTISNNHFIGVADNGFNPFDNAIWVYAPLVGVVPNIENNEFDHLWQAIHLELPTGGALVTGNNFHDLFAQSDGVTTYPPEAMYLWAYGGVNITAPVTINNNIFSAFDGWSVVLKGGGSGNAQFINDVTINGNNINADGAGIVLHNPATTLSDAAQDGIVGATISGNTIMSITPGTGTGIWLRGPNNNTTITNSKISGYANGILSEEYSAGAGTSAGVAVHLNSLTGNNTSVSNQGPSTIDATVNYWGGCPSVSNYVSYYPYYTTCTGDPGSFIFGGQINNIVANASQTTICAGSSTTIYATGGSDYVWDNGLGLGSSKVVSPAINTTYNVTANDANSCTGASASVTITVNPLPVVLIEGSPSGSSTIVLGNSKSLTASGATSYLWSTGSTANPITVSPATTTSYSVIGTTGSCSASAMHTVNVAIVTAGSNQFICQGGSANLNATVTGVTVTSYSWSPAGSLSDPTIQNPVATPANTTTYTVVVNGIADLYAHVTVVVHPKPVANAGPDVIIASGGSGTLSGNATGGSAPYSWSWTGPSGFTSSQQNPTVNTAGTYTLIVTDAFGCVSDPDQAIVTVTISGYTVSGNIAYAYGTVNPQMHNVTVTLKQGGVTKYTAVTPASGNGNYQFLGVTSGTYDVYFSLTTTWGGLTSADITAIQKHYTPPVVLLHGIKLLAADVYLNSPVGLVNVNDRDLVNQRRLNSNCGCFTTGDWVFTKAEAIGTDPGTYIYANSGGISNMQIIVGAGDLSQDFRSLCYGDVDASYTGLKEFEIDNQIVDVTNVDTLKFINYPNPFSDHTTLSYSLPVAGDVQICIYNLMGERVDLLEKPGQTEGVYEYKWNTKDLSQGIYLGVITLKTSDDILRRHIKMLLYK